MNLEKSYEYFKPEQVKGRIHIIGCGSVGSTLAELMVRSGLTKITLWDFDKVEEKNIANQLFRKKDVYKEKTEALKNILMEINPDVESDLVLNGKWDGQMLSGYVFLAVDNIETRKRIIDRIWNNLSVKAVFDIRTRLEDAQHYAARWDRVDEKEDLRNSMDFSHEEAMEETPMSACHTVLSVAPTIRIVCSFAIANFMNLIRGNDFKKLILVNAFGFQVDAF